MLRCVVALLLVILTAGWTAETRADEPLLTPFNAMYTVKREGMVIGENQRTLTAGKDGRYVYESIARATGWVAWLFRDEVLERSVWVYANSRIRPLEYTYGRSRGRNQRRVQLAFDWDRKLVTNNVDSDAWRMPLPDDAQDKLVYQLSIMRDMQRPHPDLVYHIADGGMIKTYKFAITGQENLPTPMGTMHTVKIERVGDKRDTSVWLAPSLQYLPVKISQTDKDGSELSMHLSSVTGIVPR